MTPHVASAPRDNIKMAEHVAAQIRADIMARGWPVGEVLATEPELIERYGVSRSVLREAVRIVEYLGVAHMRQGPGGGLVVTAPDARAVTSAVLIYFAYARVSLEDVLGARWMIEEAAVELAAQRASDAQLAWLRDRLDEYVPDATERGDHATFHDAIATLTANPAIVLFVTIISRVAARYGATGRPSPDRLRHERLLAVAGHRDIVDAICARQPDVAVERLRRHLAEMEAFLLGRSGRPAATIGDRDRDFPGTKLGGQVAVDLLVDVVQRGWPVGELIGTENELMARCGVSRSVVREAVRLLEFHQVVSTRRGPGGGVFVAAPSADAVAQAMAVHLEFQGLDKHQLFEVRCALELATVERAAVDLDGTALDQLRDALAIQQHASLGAVAPASHAVHDALAELTGNRAVWFFLLVLIRLTEERAGIVSADGAAAVGQAHAAIVDAIAARDPVTARRRMQRHLEAIAPTMR
jgi:DNA-binding FadR family transcriptional regulator